MMSSWKVRYKLLLLTLIPAICIALLLGSYYTYRTVTNLDKQIIKRGRAIVSHLAPASEYGVISGNISFLKQLSDNTLRQTDVLGVSILDKDGAVLYENKRSVSPVLEPRPVISKIAGMLFNQTDLTFGSKIHLTDVSGTAETSGEQAATVKRQAIGKVRVILTQKQKNYQQTLIIVNSVIGILLALAVTSLFALYIGRTISRPIERLTFTVNNIQSGDLGSRSRESSGGEIGLLEKGVNQMAETIQNSHKRMALETRNATSELRKKINEINEKNYELEVARSRAEEANIAKSRFLANMSHELRTPMNAILGFTDLLSNVTKDPEHNDYLKTIRRSASDLLVLINEILDYSKIESGELKIDTLDFNVYEMIDDVVSLLNRTAHDKYLDFLLYIDPKVPVFVHTDPLRIKQAIINLVSNAIKFTDKGHVALEVHFRDSGSESYLEFRVIDTGIGIEDPDDRIFEPFAQRDDSLTREHAGTGLGLSITKYFVEKLNGAIGYTSRPNKGSTFWFTIPYSASQTVLYYEQNGKPLSTLVYDRSPVRVSYTHDMLSAWSYPVKITSGIEEFLAEFSSGKYELVLYYLNRNDIDTDLQISINHLAAPDNCIKFFLHNNHYYEDLSAVTGFHHIANVITPYHLFNYVAENTTGPAADSASISAIQTYTGEIKGTTSLHGITVLIADDNDINQRLLQVYVTRNGGDFFLANDGESAIEIAEREKLDIIVMDVHMPKTDGITAMKTIKNQEPDMPIVAVTADAGSNSVTNYMNTGFDACLIKPVTEKKLVGTVLSMVHQADVFQEGVAATETESIEPESPGDLPVIDIENAIKISGGNRQLSHELYNMLVVDLKNKRTQLMGDNDDTTVIKEIAHKIRGGAKYCAAERLHYHASKLESAITAKRDQAAIGKLTSSLVNGINEVLSSENPYK